MLKTSEWRKCALLESIYVVACLFQLVLSCSACRGAQDPAGGQHAARHRPDQTLLRPLHRLQQASRRMGHHRSHEARQNPSAAHFGQRCRRCRRRRRHSRSSSSCCWRWRWTSDPQDARSAQTRVQTTQSTTAASVRCREHKTATTATQAQAALTADQPVGRERQLLVVRCRQWRRSRQDRAFCHSYFDHDRDRPAAAAAARVHTYYGQRGCQGRTGDKRRSPRHIRSNSNNTSVGNNICNCHNNNNNNNNNSS